MHVRGAPILQILAPVGVQEGLDHLHGHLGADNPAAHAEDVGVVDGAGHLGRVHALAGDGVDALELVGHDAHAGAGAADEHGLVVGAVLHQGGHLGGHLVIGVDLTQIHGAQIVKLDAGFGEPGADGFLGGEAGLIAADGNFHNNNSFLIGPFCERGLPQSGWGIGPFYLSATAFLAVSTMFSTVRPMASRR